MDGDQANSEAAHVRGSECALSGGKPSCEGCLQLSQSGTETGTTDLKEKTNMQPTLLSKVNQRHDSFTSGFPVEIMAHIFTLCIAEVIGNLDLFLPFGYGWSAAIQIAAVCTTWREVALAMPHIWTSIHVVTGNPDFSIPKLVKFVKLWLSRSRNQPLKIALTCWSADCPLYPLFDVLREHSARWNWLELYISPTLYSRLLDGMTNTPLLETLELHPDPGDPSAAGLLFDVEMPQLRHVVISGLDVVDLGLPWETVTSVELRAVWVEDVFELLSNAISLVDLKLVNIVEMTGTHSMTPTTFAIEHTSLKSLHLQPEGFYHDEWEYFFRDIALPSLESLNVAVQQKDLASLFDNLFIFLARSCPEITHFTINIEDGAPGGPTDLDIDVAEFFWDSLNFSKLTHLRIVDPLQPSNDRISMIKSVLRRFRSNQCGGTTSDFLLHLEVLEYEGMVSFPWWMLAIASAAGPSPLPVVVPSRPHMLKRLEILILPSDGDDLKGSYIDEYLVPIFLESREEGVVVNITYDKMQKIDLLIEQS